MVRDRDGRPPRGPLLVHCFCVCSGELMRNLAVSRSMERDLLCVLSIYPRIFLCIHCVSSRIMDTFYVAVFYYMFMCELFWFSCQYLPIDWLERLLLYGEEITSTKPRSKKLFVRSFLSFSLFMLPCFPLALNNIYFVHIWHDIAYLCSKCR